MKISAAMYAIQAHTNMANTRSSFWSTPHLTYRPFFRRIGTGWSCLCRTNFDQYAIMTVFMTIAANIVNAIRVSMPYSDTDFARKEA